jgi:hypothetical protein
MLRFAPRERNDGVAAMHDASRRALQLDQGRTCATRAHTIEKIARSATISSSQSTPASDMVVHDDAEREAIAERTQVAPNAAERGAPVARVVSGSVGVVRAPRCRA